MANNGNIKKVTQYVTRVLIIIGLLIFAYLFANSLKVVLMPILFAIVLAYLIMPIVNWMVKMKIPKGASIILIYLLIFVFCAICLIFVWPGMVSVVKQVVNGVPAWFDSYQVKVLSFVDNASFSGWSNDFKIYMQKQVQDIFVLLQEMSLNLLGSVLKNSLSSLEFFVGVFIVLFVAYYAIIDSDNIKRSILWLLPKKWRECVKDVGHDANVVIYSYIKGQLLLMLIVSVMYSIVYWFIGLKYAILLGVIGGIFNAIPYVGPYIGAIPAIIMSLTGSMRLVIITLVAIIVMQQIDNSYISPKIMENKLGISPLVTIFSIIVFGEFFGFIGILLGVPFATIGILIIRKFVEFKRRDEPDSEKYLDKFS